MSEGGTCMVEHVRLILLQASLQPAKTGSSPGLHAWVSSLYGRDKPTGVVDALLQERAAAHASELDQR